MAKISEARHALFALVDEMMVRVPDVPDRVTPVLTFVFTKFGATKFSDLEGSTLSEVVDECARLIALIRQDRPAFLSEILSAREVAA